MCEVLGANGLAAGATWGKRHLRAFALFVFRHCWQLRGAAYLATESLSDVSLSAAPNGHVEIIPSGGWLAVA